MATGLLGVGLVAAVVPTAAAQERARPWSTRVRVEAALRYDDNPFLLTTGKKRRLDPVSAADAQSGRFSDMESATDVIAIPTVELALDGPGLARRPVEIVVDATYEANFLNGRRRHAELKLEWAQSLGHGSRLRLGADWRPAYFHKAYLSDAVDANGDGDITPEERVYEPGSSREVDVALRYRHRLARRTRERPVEIMAEVGIGYVSRTYDAPFPGRSRRGGGASAEVTVEGRRWKLDVDYRFESLTGDATREVLILDETAFGGTVDFNGNGDLGDVAARAFELVNRSRREQELGLTLEGGLGDRVTARAGYARRLRRFTSRAPYDIVHRGRDDALDELALAFDVRLRSGVHLVVRGRRAAQETNRSGDPGSTGEVEDYTRHVGTVALQYRF